MKSKAREWRNNGEVAACESPVLKRDSSIPGNSEIWDWLNDREVVASVQVKSEATEKTNDVHQGQAGESPATQS